MAVQNPYNNYMSRTTQKSANTNFKKKVANSLSGVPKNTNNITINTPPVGQNTPQQPITTPPVTNNVSPSSTVNPTVQQPVVNPTQPQQVSPVPQQTTPAPVPDGESTQGMGMMSLEEVNGAFVPQQEETNGEMNPRMARGYSSDKNIVPGTNMTREQYEAEVKRKQDAGIPLDKPYIPKTPQELANDLYEQQQSQAQKDWELKQEAINNQINGVKDSYEQSKKDAENAYNKTVDSMNENRYQQMEDLNISGGMRGIQYSPQQLGLENVANINHNKNLADASNQRNELLNKLQIEVNKTIENLNMGMLNATNEYNKTVGNLKSDYMQTMMQWQMSQKEKEEQRKWEEMMAQKDKDFQAQQNQLDRDKYGRSSGGGSSYSYGGYSPSSYSRSGYSNYNGNNGYDNNYNDSMDLSDETNSLAYEDAFNDFASDTYGGITQNLAPYNSNNRAKAMSEAYQSEMGGYLDYAKGNGMSASGMRNLTSMYDRDMNNFFENYGIDENDTMLNRGNNRLEHALDYNKTRYAQDERTMRALLNEGKKMANPKKDTKQKATKPKPTTKSPTKTTKPKTEAQKKKDASYTNNTHSKSQNVPKPTAGQKKSNKKKTESKSQNVPKPTFKDKVKKKVSDTKKKVESKKKAKEKKKQTKKKKK